MRQETIQHLKSNVASNERSAWSGLLKENDSRALWNKINWNGKCEYVSSSSKPELAELREQFKMKGQSVENSTLLSDVTGDTFVDELDAEISVEEIAGAQKSIKEDEASSDGWKRMITGLPVCLLYELHILYNAILSSHSYPSRWRTTIVSEIFKNKGETKHAKNYRGVSLVALLSKLLTLLWRIGSSSGSLRPIPKQHTNRRNRVRIMYSSFVV